MSSVKEIMQAGQGAAGELANIEAQWSVARMFRRDELLCSQEILDLANNLRFAESAHFLYSRGGKEVKGPSIRAAEAMARVWGNLDWGYRIVSQNDERTVADAYCTDLERNNKQSRRFIVPHVRHTKRGSYKLTDPRDIAEAVGSRGMRLVRECVLSMIPEDVIDQFDERCDRTILDTLGTLPEAKSRMIDAFAKIGVKEAKVADLAGKPVGDINQYDILRLRRIYASMKDGDGFESQPKASKNEQAIEELVKKSALPPVPEKPKEAPASVQEPPPPPPPPQPQEPVMAPQAPPQEAEEAAEKPTKTTIGRMLGAFGRRGVSASDIVRKMGKKIDDLTMGDVGILRHDQAEIRKDPENIFRLGFKVEEPTPELEPEQATETTPEPEPEPAHDSAGEQEPGHGSIAHIARIKRDLLMRIKQAMNPEDIQAVDEDVEDLPDWFPEDEKDEIYEKVIDRYQQIANHA